MGSLPDLVVGKLQNLPKGEKLIVSANDGLTILFLLDSKPSPVTLSEAELQIRNALQTQKRQQAAQSEIERLRTEYKTEYLVKTEAGHEAK